MTEGLGIRYYQINRYLKNQRLVIRGKAASETMRRSNDRVLSE